MPRSPSAFSGWTTSASAAARYHIEGLKLFVPHGRGEIVSQRMAHLDQSAAKWQLYQVGERAETCEELDFRDHGNLATRLVRAVDPRAQRGSVLPHRSRAFRSWCPTRTSALSRLRKSSSGCTDWSSRGPGWRRLRDRFAIPKLLSLAWDRQNTRSTSPPKDLFAELHSNDSPPAATLPERTLIRSIASVPSAGWSR